jgi:hypothetical protein
MFEIAETFMDSEDYDQAVKFYDRLWRLDQLRDFDRAIVRFKQGVAHYRRALDNLRKLDRNKDLAPELRQEVELPFDKTPRADFAKVKGSASRLWNDLPGESVCSRVSLHPRSHLRATKSR